MSVQEDVVTALATVGDGKLYPQVAPADAELPFVVYRRLSQEPLLTLGGATAATKSVMEFACCAKTYAEALSLADTVRATLYASSLNWFPVPAPGEAYEPEVDGFMEPVYAGFWVND